MGWRTALAAAWRWRGEGADRPAMLAAGAGMALPTLLGALAGQLPLGLAVALGGLLAGSARTTGSFRDQARGLVLLFAAVACAAAAAVLVAGHGGWTDLSIVLLAGFAALLGGYSLPLAVATGRFLPFFAIALGLVEAEGDRLGLAALLVAGALWTSLLALALGSLFRALGWQPAAALREGASASAARQLRRWSASLKSLAGWQFALRLMPCLALAGLLRALFPEHHLLWIAITVALLCQRQPGRPSERTLQRAVGAALGVAATGLLLGRLLPGWALASLVSPLSPAS